MNKSSLQYLQTTLTQIDDLIKSAVERAQAVGHDPTDALRGLIISEDEVAQHLNNVPLHGFWPENFENIFQISVDNSQGDDFVNLIASFHLTVLDSSILLLCIAPELDRRYERLYAYLQDDVSQRYPTVNLMMNLLGGEVTERFAVWERLADPTSPLRRYHLIDCISDPARSNSSFLAYHIKPDDRIIAHLLGNITPDERIKYAVQIESSGESLVVDEKLVNLLAPAMPTMPMIYIHGKRAVGQRETAALISKDMGLSLLSVDLSKLANSDGLSFELGWQLAVREGYLANAALYLDAWEACLNENDEITIPSLWDALVQYPYPVFLCSARGWEPLDIDRTRRLLRVEWGIPSFVQRRETWREALHRADISNAPVDELAAKFRFSRGQIARSVHTALDLAHSRGELPTAHDLYAAAQAHASMRLGRLAKRIVPRFTWEHLILPTEQLSQLYEISDRARYAHVIHDEWGFGRRLNAVSGVSALFAGDSGTGKTLAAEVIANELGLVLYKIDLSSVVSKYIGETEKNLGVIFEEAQSCDAVLFFDEADALFGKRSEVKDARDRYANIEIAYLLQQIESYDGVAIMATNLRQNLDEAFTRRIDFLIDFPFPESEYRQRIWEAHFPPEAPLGSDVNLATVAENYRLAGGNIRNAALASAYLAAADGGVITMQHIRSAIRREHQKMGKLLDDRF